ncbi:MAG: CorA family divalent cation transporter, partial [Rhodospirillales bacterium]
MITAWCLDGKGGGREITLAEDLPSPDDGAVHWVHVTLLADESPNLLSRVAKVPEAVLGRLFSPDTRPRCELYREGTLINLRGMNLNPGAGAQEMISVRLWVTDNRILSVRRLKMMSIDAIRRRLADGQLEGPCGPGDFLAQLNEELAHRLDEEIESLNNSLDGFEDRDSLDEGDLDALVGLQRGVVKLRRFLSPQQSALSRLTLLEASWMRETDRNRIKHVLDDTQRFLEDLDAIHDRSSLLKEGIVAASQNRMNKTMYLLTVVAGVFLPLTFVTGLLGMNVAGMPGLNDPWSFWWTLFLLGA